MEPIEWDRVGEEFPDTHFETYQYTNRFNYCTWIPSTEIKLCNVVWDSQYKNVVTFDNEEARDAYFASLDSESITLTGMVYLRYGEPIRVNIPFGEAVQYNYIVVRNPNMPVPNYKDNGIEKNPDYKNYEYFFYFINHLEYLAPNTTAMYIQLDAWQTYSYRCHLGPSFLDRGHAGIANKNCNIYNLDEYLLEPEGLDLGNEYDTVAVEKVPLGENEDSFDGRQTYYVIISSMASLEDPFGSINQPNLVCSNGSAYDNVPEGTETYAIDLDSFPAFMEFIADYPWISQCISHITMVPTNLVNVDQWKNVTLQGTFVIKKVQGWSRRELYTTFKNWRNYFTENLGGYSHLLKFLTSFYSFIEATTLTGGEIILKPECLVHNDDENKFSKDDLVFHYINSLAPPNMRTSIYPVNYNGTQEVDFEYPNVLPGMMEAAGYVEDKLYGGENLDLALTIDNWPQFSLTNNMYLYYMASTVNTRNYLFKDADWTYQKAMLGADTAYSNASAGIRQTTRNTDAQKALINANSAIAQEQNSWNQGYVVGDAVMNTLGDVTNSVGYALSAPNAAGMIGGIAGAAVSVGQGIYEGAKNMDYYTTNSGWIDQSRMANLANTAALGANARDYQMATRDNNYAYAQKAAEGDKELAIAAVNAKVQDARLTQPTTSGQNGGDKLLMSHWAHTLMVKFKLPKPQYIRQIGDFWSRYGYAVNRFIQPPEDLRLMSNFTYWRFMEVNLWGHIPDLFKDAIKGILESGTTIWSDPEKICTTMPLDNEVTADWGY